MVINDDTYAALQSKGATNMVGRNKNVQFGKKRSLGKLRLRLCAEKEFIIVKEKLHDLHKSNRKGPVKARPMIFEVPKSGDICQGELHTGNGIRHQPKRKVYVAGSKAGGPIPPKPIEAETSVAVHGATGFGLSTMALSFALV